uniref:Uncharacterized protein n=1 Tax=Cyprinus carpio carpio TaxID=630221 RepID=A0A9J8C6Z0_CYPCA
MRDESTEPTYGCQVTIQSEQEKQMMKIYRKEEKKERKREKRGDTCENKFHFDPKEMRSQRQDTSSARSRTLCRHSENDRQTTTTRSSFLMLLPEGIRRENNKMYEEVEIPHNEPMPTGFKEKPVYILELDENSVEMDGCHHQCDFTAELARVGGLIDSSESSPP